MEKNKAIEWAIGALIKQYNEKSWDAHNSMTDYGQRCKEICEKLDEAIHVLEGLKDAKTG